MPRVRWYKEDGSEIVESDTRYKISYDLENGKAELLIKCALISDEQSYKCVASNEHGTSKTIGVLVVKANKSAKSPSPNRSLEPPSSTGQLAKRTLSPLRNIDVPPSNLHPVKEESELSSSQSETEICQSKNAKSSTDNQVAFSLFLIYLGEFLWQ